MSIDQKVLFERVKNILLQPNSEWDKINTEPTTIAELYKNYIAVLAAASAVCGFIGSVVFGYGFWMVSVHIPVFFALGASLKIFILSLISVAILGLVIDFLAPSFQGQQNRTQAFKVAAYSLTAKWVSGVLALLPGLAVLGMILGLYSFYLLYCGLPKLMKNPQEKTVAYTASVVVVAIIVQVIIGAMVYSPFGGGYTPSSQINMLFMVMTAMRMPS